MIKVHYVDVDALKARIKKIGVRRAWLCQQLRITYPTLSAKVNGKTPFTAAEIAVLQRILSLTDAETVQMFIRQVR